MDGFLNESLLARKRMRTLKLENRVITITLVISNTISPIIISDSGLKIILSKDFTDISVT